jgi:hypothetical protein
MVESQNLDADMRSNYATLWFSREIVTAAAAVDSHEPRQANDAAAWPASDRRG